MNAFFGLLAVVALALLLIAGAVFGLNDTSLLVAPPEAVAEGFVRQLAAKRFERALPYLTDELKAETSKEALKSLADRLKQATGEINDVRGERVWMTAERAEAAVVLKTKMAGMVRLTFPLSRSSGVWKVAALRELEPYPAQP